MIYVGIDGGGTTSDYVLLDEQRHLMAQSSEGPTNIHSHGQDMVFKHIKNGLKILFEAFEFDKDDVMITLSSAGVDRPEDVIPYEAILKSLGYKNYLVINDAQGALSAGTQGENGIIVIAGTGSIVFGKKENELKRVGGWGHILGDEGSAYKIAITAIQKVIQASDGYGQKTLLEEQLLKEIKGKTAEDFLCFIYQKSFKKDVIANLAKVVDEACEMKDHVAKAIIEKEAILLSKQVIALYKQLFLGSKKVPLVLNGSVLKKSKTFLRTFAKSLENYPFDLIMLDVNAAYGAAYLGQKKVENDKSIR